jgi:hypothetical protein
MSLLTLLAGGGGERVWEGEYRAVVHMYVNCTQQLHACM